MSSSASNVTPIYLMDASAFIHRAFHAIRNLKDRQGRPTGAAYGFTTTVLKLLREKQPSALAIVYDSRGPSRRHALYPAYKANRPSMDPDLVAQQAIIRNIITALGLYTLEKPGFEADDLIAALCRQFVQKGREVIIVSGDKDFYQLLSDQVTMYDPDPKKNSALTLSDFTARYGLTPAGFLEMQALMGDTSDNIPGVPKVGEKTALKLISQFGSLDELYRRLSEVEPITLRAKLADNEESARISRELAFLGRGLDLETQEEELCPQPPDVETLTAIFKELSFEKFLRDLEIKSALPSGMIGSATIGPTETLFSMTLKDDAVAVSSSIFPESPSVVNYEAYIKVDNQDAWVKLLEDLRHTERLAVDLETDSLSPSQANLVGMSLATAENRAYYIPINHDSLLAKNQPWDEVKAKVGPYLEDPAVAKVGQNAKYDWLILARYGLKLPIPADDPMLAAYLLNPDDSHGLDALSSKYLGHRAISFKDVVPGKGSFRDVDTDVATRYAAEDADLTLRLAGILSKELKKSDELDKLYREVELPLEELLTRMEKTGILIDTSILAQLSRELGQLVGDYQEKIFQIAGHQFNLASPKQLAQVLFQEQGLPSGRKTSKTKEFSTDNSILTELAHTFPIAKAIMSWREAFKLKNTYTDKLPLAINPETGRIHTSFNQTQTATGRLSSSDPNLQNIPARNDIGQKIRSAFVAKPGYSLVSADYSQIELRVMAHFSKDQALLKAFANNEDIHTQTASEIFGLPLGEVTPVQRREAKTINFGIIFGQGAFGLSKQLEIPQSAARDFIKRYFIRFPGVKQFMDDTRQKAQTDGWVSTWYGRRRYLPALLSGGYNARQEAERMAINTPIQGTAADLIKMAMIKVDRRLQAEHPLSRILLQVHDELVLEVPTEEAAAVKELLIREMVEVGSTPILEYAQPLSVPLKVEVGIGQSWTHS